MISRLKRFGLHEILRGGISRKVHTLRRFSRRRVAYEATGRRVMIKRGGLAFGDLAGSMDSYDYNARSEVVTALREKDGSEVYGFLEDFAYDPIGNRTESAVYDENGVRYASAYETDERNRYVSRTVPGLAAVRGDADARATVTVNENPAFRLGGYFYGTAAFDNAAAPVEAQVETYAALPSDGEGGDDLVAAVTNRVHVPQSPEVFAYDANGNQTVVETPTGRWTVEWNAENRPVRWTCGNRTLLMAYDHEGRRVRYVETTGGITNRVATFLYDGYLCITRTVNGVTDRFLWDPTEPVATRPLAMVADGTPYLYTHDANKNVSELVNARTGETAAHYDYSAFGKTLIAAGFLRNRNPFRFSSEYVDDATGLTYYNWRHYDPVHGRWISEDPIGEKGGLNLYGFSNNNGVSNFDINGCDWSFSSNEGEVAVSYTLEPKEQECCKSVTIIRYVKKLPIIGGGTIGKYELDHKLDISEHDNGVTGFAEGDHPDGVGFFIWRSGWTQKFKWEAVCIEGKNKGKVISTAERYYRTEWHFLWNESTKGEFSIDNRLKIPLVITGPILFK